MITLICKTCLSLVPVSKEELENGIVTHCPNCDTSLDTGCLCPTEQRVNDFIRQMFRVLGIESTLEFIQKGEELPYIHMYKKAIGQLGLTVRKQKGV